MTYQEKREAINKIYKACAEGDALEADLRYAMLDDHFENNGYDVPQGIAAPIRNNIGLAYLDKAEKDAEDMPYADSILRDIATANDYLGEIPGFEQRSRRILEKGLETHLKEMRETADVYCTIFPGQKKAFLEYCMKTGLRAQDRLKEIESFADKELVSTFGFFAPYQKKRMQTNPRKGLFTIQRKD